MHLFTTTTPTEIIRMKDIENIVEALRTEDCVLVLGPKAASFEGELLQDLLAERLAQSLKLPADSPRELPQLARQLRQASKNETEALEKTGTLLREFYEEFADEKIPLYELVARLPFRCILNCTPDSLLLEALRRQNKKGLFYSFHFSKPEHNKNADNRATDLEKEISDDSPLVYNLLGHYDDASSLVLTDADRLRFLEVVLQREKEASLPPNVAYHFLRPPVHRLRKTFLFIGFDFNEWHLRLFMHLLRRNNEHLPRSLSLQNEENLERDAAIFYTDNFDMLFVPHDPSSLLEELRRQLSAPPPPPPAASMELLLLYHPADESLRDELETYLSTLRNSGLVKVWHEACILASEETEAEMQQHLGSAGIILPLVTANLLADDRFYHDHLSIALRRHDTGEAKLVPLLYSPCDVIGTPLFELNTFYPKPKGRAVSQKPDRKETLTTFAQELRGIVERILNQPNTRP